MHKFLHLDFLFMSFVCVGFFHLLAGSGTGTIVRPKVHYTRPPHPPPDPPIPEACATGPFEPRVSLFSTHEPEHPKQRHSYPERLVRSRSTDIVCAGRRPNSDPGINRRTMVEDQDQAAAFPAGSTTSPSKDALRVEVCRTCYFNFVVHDTYYWPYISIMRYGIWLCVCPDWWQEGQWWWEIRQEQTLVEEKICSCHS